MSDFFGMHNFLGFLFVCRRPRYRPAVTTAR